MSLSARHAIGPFWTQALFWKQAALNSVGPIVAAVFGGAAVDLVVRLAQNRRELHRLRSSLSTDMMRTAYGFYRPMIEIIRTESYANHLAKAGLYRFALHGKSRQKYMDMEDLTRRYEEFRIAARVIEEQLRVDLRSAKCRWLWHGVVDTLSARYYRLAHIPERYNGLVNTHGQHSEEAEIPREVREFLMTPAQYKDLKTVDDELLYRFERLLNEASDAVLRCRFRKPGGVAFLRPGRGSLGHLQHAR
jgi:hypothetical protein